MSEFKSPASWSGEDTYRLVLLVVLVAALWGFLALTGSRYLIYPDAMEYAQTARSWSQGRGATTQTIWLLRTAYPLTLPPPDVRRPLLWPVILSGFFRVLGATDWVATFASGCMGCLGAALFFALARRFMQPLEAFLTTLVLVLQPQIVLVNQSGLSEPLFICLLLLIAHAGLRARRPWHFLIVGLLLGLAQWVRLNGFLLAVPVALWLAVRRRPGGWSSLLMLLAGFALVGLPLALRNYRHLGEFSMLNLARYSVVGEIPPYPDHGAERSLERISVIAVFARQPGAVVAKYIRGLSSNLTALFSAAHPVLWGLWLVPLMRSRGQEEASRLCRYGLAVLLLFWWSFSIGEFEGARFYVPLVPLVVLGAMVGLRSIVDSPGESDSGSVPAWLRNWRTVAVLILLLLPGLFTLGSGALSPPSGQFREELSRVVEETLPPDAVVGSDVPWAVGWYGARLAVWLPIDPREMATLNERLEVDWVMLSSSVHSAEWGMAWSQIYQGTYNLPGYRRVEIRGAPAGMVFFEKDDQAGVPRAGS